MPNYLADYYRIPERLFQIACVNELTAGPQTFTFNGVAYWGKCAQIPAEVESPKYNLPSAVFETDRTITLPFDLSEVVDNLRLERYVGEFPNTKAFEHPVLQKLYYVVRPALPTFLRRLQQRRVYRRRLSKQFPTWPVDFRVENLFELILTAVLKAEIVDRIPFVWFWPEGRSACVILSHDVETQVGLNFCPSLMKIDEAAGLRSAFQIIPEQRYVVSSDLMTEMRARGFEVNVHDLNHDGKLFENRTEFSRRASEINRYAKKFGSKGYRSGVLYRNQSWYDEFQFEYDMSVPNVGHLEAQFGGCCTVMPYFVGNILELPLTTTQDYVLFTLFRDYSIARWKEQANLILGKHGMISFLTHPDYLLTARTQESYNELLKFICTLRDEHGAWFALPGEVNEWWRSRSRMRLVRNGSRWVIEGKDSERARVAYARLKDGRLVYEMD